MIKNKIIIYQNVHAIQVPRSNCVNVKSPQCLKTEYIHTEITPSLKNSIVFMPDLCYETSDVKIKAL